MENYCGVVCSKEKKEVYCIKGSHEYQRRFQEFNERKDISIICINICDYNSLVSQNLNISNWNIEDVLKLEVKNVS